MALATKIARTVWAVLVAVELYRRPVPAKA